MDFLYLGIVVLFFFLTWGLMHACERLQDRQSGDKP
jgi:hypothetical protein